MLASSGAQAEAWRRRYRLAPGDVFAVTTTDGYLPPELDDALNGALPGEFDVVLLEGWRHGRYADRLTWNLAQRGFDFSAVRDAR